LLGVSFLCFRLLCSLRELGFLVGGMEAQQLHLCPRDLRRSPRV
jgi:hypothetical protein